jgi:hypothetical protein
MSSTKYAANERSAVDCSRSTRGFWAAFLGRLAGDEAFFGHPRQHVVVAAGQRAFGVDERAEAGRRLDDGGQRGRFFERHVLGRLVEIHPRARFDP